MLEYGTVTVPPSSETEIVSWTADGAKHFCGFVAGGESVAKMEYRCYFNGALKYKYRVPFPSREDGPASVVVPDRAVLLSAGTVVSLRAYHEAADDVDCEGTLLGG